MLKRLWDASPLIFFAWGLAWGGLAWFCDTVVYLLKNLVIALHFTLNSKGIEGWTGKNPRFKTLVF